MFKNDSQRTIPTSQLFSRKGEIRNRGRFDGGPENSAPIGEKSSLISFTFKPNASSLEGITVNKFCLWLLRKRKFRYANSWLGNQQNPWPKTSETHQESGLVGTGPFDPLTLLLLQPYFRFLAGDVTHSSKPPSNIYIRCINRRTL